MTHVCQAAEILLLFYMQDICMIDGFSEADVLNDIFAEMQLQVATSLKTRYIIYISSELAMW